MANPEVRFNAFVDNFDPKGAYHFINVPDEIALSLTDKFPFRAVCTIRNHTFHCGIVKHGIDGFVIQMGKQTMKKAQIIKGESIEIKLIRDTSEYGYEMPEEMRELLLQDEEGNKNWEALNPGTKRSILYYVCGAKSSEVRIKRAMQMLERAREILVEKKTK